MTGPPVSDQLSDNHPDDGRTKPGLPRTESAAFYTGRRTTAPLNECLAVKGSVPGTGQSALAGRAGLGDGGVMRQVRWVVGAGARRAKSTLET